MLIVIDNSGSMGEEQANLARNFPNLIQRLQNLQNDTGTGNAVADVNIMLTTTDLGNTRCYGTTPEGGDPVTTGCNEKIADGQFAAVGTTIPDASKACTDVCEDDVVIQDDRPFIHFRANSNNVEDVEDKDVNGDGTPDDEVAQALACLGPQGIHGCGLESPLEAMMQALDPNADHNKGDEPFLRKGAMLAILLMTDEADCSIDETQHPEIFDEEGDKEFWEVNPHTEKKEMTSAVCWNAGVECTGDSPYECESTDEPLRSLDRYKNYLNHLIDDDGKEVVMLGIVGVPPVTEHNEEPPYEPTAGGVLELEYRDWVDELYPEGDILPEDDSADPRRGADYQQYAFGIGPGCTGETDNGEFTGQAIPPRRIRDVCESLNREPSEEDEEGRIRCCMESICDDDFSAAIQCLTGLVEVVPPPQ
ncbi:MAG: hypothetical protein B7733_04475 [Myxococcales bacterium FL481]|nr:MAG: hypothetical protein B7733_04475 [Myxococcales bacterium FL481]